MEKDTIPFIQKEYESGYLTVRDNWESLEFDGATLLLYKIPFGDYSLLIQDYEDECEDCKVIDGHAINFSLFIRSDRLSPNLK